ncbi:MAG: DUF4397 domain-containing protein [Deltaproteobacteria bacterium]|nr:MAG: DUF4397 domain-containing protein [Deltaproteobacteria bacterium]
MVPIFGQARLLHLGVNAGPVDIWLNGEPSFLIDVSFLHATDYASFPAGTHTVDLVPSGEDLEASVLTDSITVSEGALTSIYVSGAVGEAAMFAPLSLHTFEDDPDAVMDDRTGVNAIHAASFERYETVQVWVTDSECTPLDPISETFSYGERSGVLNVETPLTVGIREGDSGAVDFCFAVPELPTGELYNLYAFNDEDGSFFLSAHAPDGTFIPLGPPEPSDDGLAVVQFVHLGNLQDDPTFPLVVKIGEIDERDLTYGTVGDPIEVIAGTNELYLWDASVGMDEVVYQGDRIFPANTDWTVFGAGYHFPGGDVAEEYLGFRIGAFENAHIEEGRSAVTIAHAIGSREAIGFETGIVKVDLVSDCEENGPVDEWGDPRELMFSETTAQDLHIPDEGLGLVLTTEDGWEACWNVVPSEGRLTLFFTTPSDEPDADSIRLLQLRGTNLNELDRLR